MSHPPVSAILERKPSSPEATEEQVFLSLHILKSQPNLGAMMTCESAESSPICAILTYDSAEQWSSSRKRTGVAAKNSITFQTSKCFEKVMFLSRRGGGGGTVVFRQGVVLDEALWNDRPAGVPALACGLPPSDAAQRQPAVGGGGEPRDHPAPYHSRDLLPGRRLPGLGE
jgi:hypothetical protein